MLALSTMTIATCGDTWVFNPPTFGPSGINSNCIPNGNPTDTTKTVRTVVFWLDGYSRTTDVTDAGQNRDLGFAGFVNCVRCYPEFQQPYWEETGNTALLEPENQSGLQ